MTRLMPDGDIPVEREPRRVCPFCKRPVRTWNARVHWSREHPEVTFEQFRAQWNLAPRV